MFEAWGMGDPGGIRQRIVGLAGLCDNRNRLGFGPLLRLLGLNVSRLALTGAGHVGGEVSLSFLPADFELGATFGRNERGSVGSFHRG
jgi:hypothetical protein